MNKTEELFLSHLKEWEVGTVWPMWWLHNDEVARFMLSRSLFLFNEHFTGLTTKPETITLPSGLPKGGREWYRERSAPYL